MKKYLSFLSLAVLLACSEGTVTGPTKPTNEAPAPVVVVATPVPSTPTVVDPTKPAEHDARVKNGFYSVTNTTGIPQFYCAAAFGVYPGGEQSAGSNIFEDQGVRRPKDVFSGQAPKTAACQYKEIQVDLTQSKDCRKFDWTNVLAAEVYPNPGFIAGTETETLPEETTYTLWSNSEGQCGTRTKTIWTIKKFKCSGEIARTVKSETTEENPGEWVTQEPEITYGAWGACVLNPQVDDFTEATQPQLCSGTKTRTKRTIIKERNTCSGAYRVKSDVTTNDTASCETACPVPLACYYTVDGQNKEWQCEHEYIGSWPNYTAGQWGQWIQQNQSHCRFPLPGTTDRDFHLVPGQSHPDCHQ